MDQSPMGHDREQSSGQVLRVDPQWAGAARGADNGVAKTGRDGRPSARNSIARETMISDWMLRLRALFKRSTVDREIDDELRFHFDGQVDAYVAQGLKHDEAVRRVRLEFGGLDQVKAEYHD